MTGVFLFVLPLRCSPAVIDPDILSLDKAAENKTVLPLPISMAMTQLWSLSCLTPERRWLSSELQGSVGKHHEQVWMLVRAQTMKSWTQLRVVLPARQYLFAGPKGCAGYDMVDRVVCDLFEWVQRVSFDEH
jgi:hypothetical protein